MTSLRIENANIIDPEHGTIAPGTLQIQDGKLTAVDETDVETTIDAGGAYAAPGFIDMHTHVFSHPLFSTNRLEADRIGVRQGVTAVVDAGSSGAGTIDAFPRFVHETQTTKVFAFVNIGSPGIPGIQGGHASRPELCDLPGVVRAIERHDWIVGVKVLASSSHTGSFGLEAVKLARKAAEVTGKPLMLHIGNAPPVIDDVLALLRPGDIVTHTFHGKVGGILGFRDRVIEPFRDAVERGVFVDVGHGRSSFSFRVCQEALAQGIPVHSISSDLHQGNVDRYAVSLARTMTKLRALGMPLIDTVRAVTSTPARILDLDGFGSLAVGSHGHISLFEEVDDPLDVEDAEGNELTAARRIATTGVVIDGIYHPRTATL